MCSFPTFNTQLLYYTRRLSVYTLINEIQVLPSSNLNAYPPTTPIPLYPLQTPCIISGCQRYKANSVRLLTVYITLRLLANLCRWLYIHLPSSRSRVNLWRWLLLVCHIETHDISEFWCLCLLPHMQSLCTNKMNRHIRSSNTCSHPSFTMCMFQLLENKTHLRQCRSTNLIHCIPMKKYISVDD